MSEKLNSASSSNPEAPSDGQPPHWHRRVMKTARYMLAQMNKPPRERDGSVVYYIDDGEPTPCTTVTPEMMARLRQGTDKDV